MDKIRGRALARGLVLEHGERLAEVLRPLVAELLPVIFPDGFLAQVNRRRGKLDPLPAAISTWSVADLAQTIRDNWSPKSQRNNKDEHGNYLPPDPERMFGHFIFERFGKMNFNELSDEFRDLQIIRNSAAHPEFNHEFTVERAKAFLRAAAGVLQKVQSRELAAEFKALIDSLDDLTMRGQTVLERVYPAEYDKDFERAGELWMTGSNMRRIATDDGDGYYLQCIKEIIRTGGTVKLLMNHPDSPVLEYSMMQDPAGAKNLDAYKKVVRDNLAAFCRIRAGEGGKNLQIRTINYMPTFGLDIMNGSHPELAIVYVRFYPLPKRNVALADRPIVKFNRNDDRWCKFFLEQFENHWNDEAQDGWAVDLPPDYPY